MLILVPSSNPSSLTPPAAARGLAYFNPKINQKKQHVYTRRLIFRFSPAGWPAVASACRARRRLGGRRWRSGTWRRGSSPSPSSASAAAAPCPPSARRTSARRAGAAPPPPPRPAARRCSRAGRTTPAAAPTTWRSRLIHSSVSLPFLLLPSFSPAL